MLLPALPESVPDIGDGFVGPTGQIPATQTEPDDLGYDGLRRTRLAWYAALTVALAISVIAGISLGPVTVAPDRVWAIVLNEVVGPGVVDEFWSRPERNIVWLVRVPRVLLAALVGAALATSGVVLQALVRNVLADPFLLGVASGASTGAAAAMLLGVGVAALGVSSLSVSAFVGALVATAALFAIARIGGRLTSTRLVLAGLSVAYAFSALTSLLIMASARPEMARSMLFWLLGGMSQARWAAVPATAVVVTATMSTFVLVARKLDALAIGDETARTMGVSPGRTRAALLIVVSLCVGGAVAAAGVIGFVGLVVPHVARQLVGTEHRRLLLVAALIGAIFLVWVDIVARVLLAPQEIPLGIITSLVGTPFLVLLVRRHATDD